MTVMSNVAGEKRFVKLEYSVEGTTVDTRKFVDRPQYVFPKPRFHNILNRKDGIFGDLWMDMQANVLHLNWFKLCDPSYKESYTYLKNYNKCPIACSNARLRKFHLWFT